MTMIFPALDRLAEVDRLTRLVAAHELYTALIAIDQRGEEPGRGVAAIRSLVRKELPAYEGDRPYGPDLERLPALLEEGAIVLPELP